MRCFSLWDHTQQQSPCCHLKVHNGWLSYPTLLDISFVRTPCALHAKILAFSSQSKLKEYNLTSADAKYNKVLQM